MCSFWGVFAIACWCGTGAPLVKGRGSQVEFRQRVNCRSIHKVALASIVFQASRGYILDSLNRISFENRISSVISQKAKYALRALVALAKEGDSLMIGEIAARKNIPRKFLEQILLEMKRHGIVHSRRGKVGKRGARSHHHRRFPRFSTSWRRGRGHWTRTGAALRASLNSSNWKQILSSDRFVAGGASTHM